MTKWYIKLADGREQGPFTELQIRRGLDSNKIKTSMQLKQGESDWMDADRVRNAFASLAQRGFFLRNEQGQVYGPFTRKRIRDMQESARLPKRYWIRQGSAGNWHPINEPKLATSDAATNSAATRVATLTSVDASADAQTSDVQPTAATLPMKPVIPAAPVMKLRSNNWIERCLWLYERCETIVFGNPLTAR